MKEKHRNENRGKRKRSGEAAVRLIAAEEEEKEEMDAIYLDNASINLSQTEGGARGHVSLYDKIWQ